MLLSLSPFVRTLYSVTVAAAVVDALYDRAVMIGGAQRRATNEEQEGDEEEGRRRLAFSPFGSGN